MQRFYEVPFSVDIHFGYRNTTFTKDEMDVEKATASFKAGSDNFDQEFTDRIINANP